MIEEERIVAVLGKSGAGKSSLANKILKVDGDLGFVVGEALDSVTQRISHTKTIYDHSFKHFPSESVRIAMTVIDTVGLFDAKKHNQAVMQKTRDYFRSEFPLGINVVLFVFRKGRFTDEEKEVFRMIRRYCYDSVSEMAALVITGCEDLDDEGREAYVKDFKENHRTKEIADFMKKGIFTVGFPKTKGMPPPLQEYYKELAEKDVDKLIQVIHKSPATYMGKQVMTDSWWASCPFV
jgi:predicted GTPase